MLRTEFGKRLEMGSKVLVVDDSPTFRSIVSVTLANAENDVTQAGDGLEGMEKLGETAFDLFVVDINMPRMGGIEFITELRKNDQFTETPVIVLSTREKMEYNQEIKDLGAIYWMVKPFTPVELLEKVSEILN